MNVKISTFDVYACVRSSVSHYACQNSLRSRKIRTDYRSRLSCSTYSIDVRFRTTVSSYLVLSRLAFERHTFRIDISYSPAALEIVSQAGERKKESE